MSANFQRALEEALREAGNKTVREALSKEIKPLNKQEAKADAGKPQLTLVPRQILFDIAEVRAFGVKKYKDLDNWKKVEIQRYRDAAFRHFMAYLDDPQGNDKESVITVFRKKRKLDGQNILEIRRMKNNERTDY